MMEAQLVLATVAQRYRLDLVPDHPIDLPILVTLVTLRSRYGLIVPKIRVIVNLCFSLISLPFSFSQLPLAQKRTLLFNISNSKPPC